MASMEKIYEYDDDDDYVPTKRVKYCEKDDTIIETKKKHTLDSDEEDEKDDTATNYDLNDEDIDGQEDATIEFEGETKITPFNMKEELEEGNFDQEGFYHFKKDDSQLKDAWLDNIDWQKVRRKDGDEDNNSNSTDSEDDLPAGSEEKQLIIIYEQILPYLEEGEAIAKALRRLGKKSKGMSRADRWKRKKLGLPVDDTNTENAAFMKLTELCNDIIATGNMDIYQETYEMVALKIQRAKTKENKTPTLDMFGDVEASSSSIGAAKTDNDEKDTFDEVTWEYKRSDGTIHGPFSSQKMLTLQEAGEFKGGAVHVRKLSEANEQWYQGSRVDFSLYI